MTGPPPPHLHDATTRCQLQLLFHERPRDGFGLSAEAEQPQHIQEPHVPLPYGCMGGGPVTLVQRP
jgi:hypothetical protein